jgi:ubiquitin-conjugating enzyme E2 Z
MSANPYENEPGFEDAKGPDDQKAMAQYVAKVDISSWEIVRLCC